MSLNSRSMSRLNGVHPDLVKVVTRVAAVSPIAFQVSEGLRSPERQAEMVKTKKSQTLNSRHLTGHAVDLVVLNADTSANWDLRNYAALNAEIQAEAKSLGIPITWGGSWKTLVDGPHWELSRTHYP